MTELAQAQNAVLVALLTAARDLSRAADFAEQNARRVRDSLVRGLNVPNLGRPADMQLLAERVNALSRVASLSGVPLEVLVLAVRGEDMAVYDWLAKQFDVQDAEVVKE